MKKLIETVERHLLASGYQSFLLAYSGGIDSTVLLDIVIKLSKKHDWQLRVVHINHGLSLNAKKWEAHCKTVCVNQSVECLVQQVTLVDKEKLGTEAAARAARYNALNALLKKDELLLTAHHQQDQAETVLLQLFRGAGVKGLSGMQRLGRPLLTCSKEQIDAYAGEHQLTWVEDESNVLVKFRRNLLRQQFIPGIKKHWPQVVSHLTQTADWCLEAQGILDEMAQQDLQACACQHSIELPNQSIALPDRQLSIEKLQTLSLPRQKNTLRYWFANAKVLMPSEAQLQQVLSSLMMAKDDAMPLVAWSDIAIRRYQNTLFITPKHIEKITILDQVIFYPGIDQPSKYECRYRQGGERIQLPNAEHSSSLKKLLQQWKVPPWWRDSLPLLFKGDRCVAVGLLAKGMIIG